MSDVKTVQDCGTTTMSILLVKKSTQSVSWSFLIHN